MRVKKLWRRSLAKGGPHLFASGVSGRPAIREKRVSYFEQEAPCLDHIGSRPLFSQPPQIQVRPDQQPSQNKCANKRGKSRPVHSSILSQSSGLSRGLPK